MNLVANADKSLRNLKVPTYSNITKKVPLQSGNFMFY